MLSFGDWQDVWAGFGILKSARAQGYQSKGVSFLLFNQFMNIKMLHFLLWSEFYQ